MRLQDLLTKKNIMIDLHSQNKIDLLTKMSNSLVTTFDLTDDGSILKNILDRESIISTGIGFGVAIPHCRYTGIDRFFMVAARISGIDFAAIDSQPVRLVFMMISPVNATTEHTQILATLSKLLSVESIREQLLTIKSAGEFLSVITDGENNL